jgi:hypothetical protein
MSTDPAAEVAATGTDPEATQPRTAALADQAGSDLRFQRRQWRFQRVGWVAMLAVALAGIAGLMGEGPMTQLSAVSPDGQLEIRTDRFTRHGAPIQLIVVVGPEPPDQVRIWVDQSYLAGLRLDAEVPEASESLAERGRVVFVFDLPRERRPAEVRFQIEPDAIGLQRARIGIVGGAEVAFDQMVYP